MFISSAQLRAVAAAALTSIIASAGASTPTQRAWTLADIVTVPEVEDLTISADGSRALYIVRQADLATNRKISTLHEVQLATGSHRQIATSAWMESIAVIPKTNDWSMLADFGQGVQLYRIDAQGQSTPLVTSPDTALRGMADGAIWIFGLMEAPIDFGILSYRWSPDGRSLWYERPVPATPDLGILRDDAAVRALVPWWPHRQPGRFEFRMKRPNGDDVLIDQRSVANYTGFYTGGAPVWSATSDAVLYSISEEDPAGQNAVANFVREIDAKQSVPVADVATVAARFPSGAKGPWGGRLSVEGWGSERKLRETLSDGAVRTHGAVGFRLGNADSRVPGHWSSADGKRVVAGVRYLDDNVRAGLVVLDRQRGLRAIETLGALTKCDFTARLDVGICVRQGVSMPPELVRVDAARGTVTSLVNLSPTHAQIAPLRIEPEVWSNPAGHRATGFVIYPRNYRAGQRYPALLVTHGSDADQRFASADMQWEYPVQVLAERGYVVICINDPVDGQEIRTALDQWMAATPTMTPERIQDLVWLSGVAAFEAAVRDLSARGLVDAERVGIAGFSRGSQMTNVTMTQSTLFKAASSGDGGYLEPAGYYSIPAIRTSYRNAFGGSPYESVALANYRRLSPTFRATQAAGPILQQIAGPHQAQIELFDALRAAGKPAQLTFYRGETPTTQETHIFHIPSNRLAAMQENLDWFDFWLLGKEDPEPAKAEQYRRWRQMREARPATNPAAHAQ